ncbi:MAG: YraN family protein [Acidobacteria bacterium]|nr:YraN family protein [Acidobacteriota bacterium]
MPVVSGRQRLGKAGEDLACRELTHRGYAVLARRFRTRFGEIDIVADHRGTVVFVEVKTRTTGLFGEAVESVPGWKRRRLETMAVEYLRRAGRGDVACRFDVVAIDDAGSARPMVRVIENAFSAGRW